MIGVSRLRTGGNMIKRFLCRFLGHRAKGGLTDRGIGLFRNLNIPVTRYICERCGEGFN